jgi:prepilin-type N-terminal cleavage/methylation domain-containing protein
VLARLEAAKEDPGFTLIELLTVMIILSVLASIAVPTFLSQRKNGWNTTTRADLANFALAVESSATDHGGDYAKVLTSAVAPTQLVASGGLLGVGLANGFEFAGSGEVDIVLASPASSNDYCIFGANTHYGPAGSQNDGWITYSKSKGGLQPTIVTTEAAAIALC